MNIIIASENPVKLNAAKNGFIRVFPNNSLVFHRFSVPSGVSDQPFSDEETFQGALNRAEHAKEVMGDADYWVGIEGGIEVEDGQVFSFAWIVVVSNLSMGKSRTANFQLPTGHLSYLNQGMELGKVNDLIFDCQNSKEKNGAVGLLTENVLTRVDLLEQSVILALTPFLKPALFLQNGIQ
ncbi:MAG: inosine/xanthosine triphosphatase [Anaerolineaceae bacterium]|nr:inosine/xanthosine triphosphatase [Anaerolineaceae bacterium]